MMKKMNYPADYAVLSNEEMTYTTGGGAVDDAASLATTAATVVGAVVLASSYIWGIKQARTWLQQDGNKDGNFVAPDDANFKAAAAGAEWNKSFYQVLTEQPGKDAWPLTGATFILMHKTQDKPAEAASTLKFFNWAYKNGDKMAADLEYVAMPESVKAQIEKSWSEIKDASGKPVIVSMMPARNPWE